MTDYERQQWTALKAEATEWLSGYQEWGSLSHIFATPGIEEYVRGVINNPELHNLMEQCKVIRFLQMCSDPRYGWYGAMVAQVIGLVQGLKFRTNNGHESITLSSPQIFDLANVFGWYGRDEKRVFRRFVNYIPRKYGKTTITAALTIIDAVLGDYNAEVYVGSNTYNQAQICFGMIRDAVRTIDIVGLKIKTKINREKIWIDVFEKDPRGKWQQTHASTISCVTNAKNLDGLNPSMAVLDELAASRNTAGQSGYDLRNVLISGMGTRSQPLEVDITTASPVVDGPFAQEMEQAFIPAMLSVLDGYDKKVEMDSTYLSLFMPDAEDEDGDPRTWAKVHPHYKIFPFMPKFYEEQWKGAILNNDSMVEFRTKLLNIFCINDEERWFSADEVKEHLLDFSIEAEDFPDHAPQCALSFDLSVIDDFSCVGYTFFNQPTKQFLCYLDYYLPEETLPGHKNEQLYRGWVRDGHLKLCPGAAIDYRMIADDILRRAQWLDIRKCGYDANKSAELRNTLDNSKPLHGRLTPFSQTNGSYNIPMEILERMFKSKTDVELPEGMPRYQLLFNHNPITPYCFGNAIIDEDSKGNRRPVKVSPHMKIDGTVVALMGIGMWYNNK